MEKLEKRIRINDNMVERARVRSLVRRGLLDPDEVDETLL